VQGAPVEPRVPLAEPAHDPPEGEVIEIAERPEGHAVAEVGAPAPQHRVEPEEQGGERAMLLPAGGHRFWWGLPRAPEAPTKRESLPWCVG